MKTFDLWESPAQFAVMQVLCFRDHERRGFATPSRREISRLLGCTKRRVSQVFDELEAMEAVTRLGVDRDFSARQRFVVSIEKAIAWRARHPKKSAAGAIDFGAEGEAGFTSDLSSLVQPASTGGEAWINGEGEAGIKGGVQPASTPVVPEIFKSDLKKEEATSPPAPRLPELSLPLFPLAARGHPEAKAIAAAKALRLQKLRSRVAGIARAILLNPAWRSVLDGKVDDVLSELVAATKDACRRKGVPGYGDVVHGQCASELFKFKRSDVLAGEAPRPRDLRSPESLRYVTKRGTRRRRPR